MNLTQTLFTIVAVVGFVFLAIVFQTVGYVQDQLVGDIVENNDLTNKSETELEEQRSSYPALWDGVFALALAAFTGLLWFAAYRLGSPGIALVVGVVLLFVLSALSAVLSNAFTDITSFVGQNYQSQFVVMNFVMSNYVWTAAGIVVGSVVTSTLGGKP